MPIDRNRITTGMSVVSSEGDQAGNVKEVRANDFLLDRPLAPDIYLPYTTAQNVAGETLTLNISAGQVDDLGWANDPPAMGTAKHPVGRTNVAQVDHPLTRPPGQTSATDDREAQQVSGPVHRFDLGGELEAMHREDLWQHKDHNAKTLLKEPEMQVVLIALKRGARIRDHQAAARITIHTIQGALNVEIAGKVMRLPLGSLLALAANVPHQLEATEDSAFVLTLASPG